MSDDEADPELLELLRQSLGWGKKQTDEISSDTGECISTPIQEVMRRLIENFRWQTHVWF